MNVSAASKRLFFEPEVPLGVDVATVRPTRVKRSAFYCEEEGVLRETKTQIKLSYILQPPESKGHKEGENIMVETLWLKILTF